MGPTRPDQTRPDPGLRQSLRTLSGRVGSGRARAVEFSYNLTTCQAIGSLAERTADHGRCLWRAGGVHWIVKRIFAQLRKLKTAKPTV